MKVIQLKNAVRIDPDASGVVAETVTVTPAMASDWLKCNTHNRPIRHSHIRFLADEIAHGNWQINGQAIVISDDEQVLDGQHRLHAIIESGIAIKTLVVYGITREAFKTIDTGVVRTGADVLGLWFPEAPNNIVKAVATAVRWCKELECGFYGTHRKIGNTEIIAYVAKHAELWRCAEILNGYPKDARPISLGCGAALYEVFNRNDTLLAETFMRKFYTGEQIGIHEPEYIVRQLLLRDAQRLAAYPIEVRMKMIVKAWNQRRRGNDVATRQAIALGPKDPDKLLAL